MKKSKRATGFWVHKNDLNTRYFHAQLLWSWVYRVKKRNIYRIVGLPGYYTLEDLAIKILESFNLCPDHHFGFYDTIDWPGASIAYETPSELFFVDFMWRTMFGKGRKTKIYNVGNIMVARAFTNIGDHLILIFDYGDLWTFLVKLVEIKEEELKNSVVVKSAGSSPTQYPKRHPSPDFDEDFPELEDHPHLKDELVDYNDRIAKILFKKELKRTRHTWK